MVSKAELQCIQPNATHHRQSAITTNVSLHYFMELLNIPIMPILA